MTQRSGSKYFYEKCKIKFLVCTYNSLNRIGEAIETINNCIVDEDEKIEIEFAIFDEAHGMAGVGKRNGYGLFEENLPVRYRLFLTAAPRKTNATKKQGSKQRRRRRSPKVSCFLNEDLFGPCIIED